MTQPTEKRCTCCGETKPHTAFHLKHRNQPDGPRRARCKSCASAERKRRYEQGSTLAYQIAAHYVDPTAPLSAEAEAVIYTDAPLNPALVALCEKRQRLAKQGQLRRSRYLQKLQEQYSKQPLPPFRCEVAA